MKSFSRLILLVAASVSAFLLVACYLFFTGFGNHVLKNSSVKQADTVAQLTFSSMYQLMSRGWTRQQVIEFADQAASSLANTPTQVSFYRAEPVSRQFGEVKNQAVDADLALALKNGRTREVDHGGGITYHMPLVAQDNCLRCHTAAKRGEVLGAISVRTEFGREMSEASMHMFLVLMLLSPTPFIAALLVALHLEHRFEDFNHGLDAVHEDTRAGRPADFSQVPTPYHEFEDVLVRIKKLLSRDHPGG